MDQPFIKTKDDETKQALIKAGFVLIDDSNGIATFINDVTKSIKFDKKKIAYTNMLAMSKA